MNLLRSHFKGYRYCTGEEEEYRLSHSTRVYVYPEAARKSTCLGYTYCIWCETKSPTIGHAQWIGLGRSYNELNANQTVFKLMFMGSKETRLAFFLTVHH